jgi:hypothetical protein
VNEYSPSYDFADKAVRGRFPGAMTMEIGVDNPSSSRFNNLAICTYCTVSPPSESQNSHPTLPCALSLLALDGLNVIDIFTFI